MKIINQNKKEALARLSPNARLQVNLQESKTPEEKFMHYIDYVTDPRNVLNKSTENMKVVMREIDNFMHLYRFQKGNLSEALFTSALFPSLDCPELVKLLLEAGANPDFQNESGNTPLHFTVYCSLFPRQKNLLLSAELLSSSMENTDVKNNLGKSALELVNYKPYWSPQENREFENAFKKIIDKPRARHIIEIPMTERSNGSFTLSEYDKKDIGLYNLGIVPRPRLSIFDKGKKPLPAEMTGLLFDKSSSGYPESIVIKFPKMDDGEEKSSSSYSMD